MCRLHVAKFLFALDEVSAYLSAFFVTLYHRRFFGCIEGKVVVFFPSPITYFPFLGNSYIVLIFNESVLFNTFCNPRCKAFTYSKKSM
ncbi:hypothetical protein BW99_09590 [Escherichia coli O157:H7 str. 08-3527]|nr:hypothetical protein BX36_12270 [Escherichia coli O157:H7 str. 2009EL2109]EYV81466.1 hypothetical protein BY91_12920 [Escherichia coli O157:H7 str. K5806]EYV85965.1 hypothetical protein BY51_25790 [Escherichia coli O157:H7 str. F7350]EYW87092.1 hypothetical protein BY19_00300 [Escherichia coli O157:H7 str. 2011EL-2099]EYW97347.1 hypothetical protein BX01_12505 [Escherichia coli O157:H7 str. 08-4169]EYX04193.1 hypothetical protein BW98_04270 [Escherichia coli O157:H7 str. 08-3037]EYX13260.1